MRMDHIKKERERIEKERAKTQLTDQSRIHERNKVDLQHRETELRRLQGEAVRAQSEMEQYKEFASQNQSKIVEKRREVDDISREMEKLQLQLAQLRNRHDKVAGELSRTVVDSEYKKKMFENKQRAYEQAEERKKREANEIERIRGENIRLESSLRLLEQKAK
jgi:peptidoglycan hydrolase CwlO-like protein